jgi:hypothetical protein
LRCVPPVPARGASVNSVRCQSKITIVLLTGTTARGATVTLVDRKALVRDASIMATVVC